MPSVVSVEEYNKVIGEDKNQDHHFAKIVDILESIRDDVKTATDKIMPVNKQPYCTAIEVSDKISCNDLDRFINKVNKEGSSIKKFYVSIQKNKCGFCEAEIDERKSLFYHIFNLARLGFNGNIYLETNVIFRLAIPIVDIAGLCLVCFNCFRNSRILYVLSNGLGIDTLQDPLNPLDQDKSPFLILPNGYITEKSISDGNNMDVMKRGWSAIHEMNLNRPHLVKQRRKAYQKTVKLIKSLIESEQTGRPNSQIHEIFSTELPYTLARYSALENFFGKTEAEVQNKDGSFQIGDFIRAYEYLEEVKRYLKLAENLWRPELLTWWDKEEPEPQDIQVAFETLRQDFLWWLDKAPLQPQDYQPPHYPPLPMRPPRFIRKFSIANYRGLTIESINLEPPLIDNESDATQVAIPVPDAAFLADNAAGKTRLLQALIWALAGCEDVKEIHLRVPERYRPKGTIITIEFFDRPETERLVVKFPNDFSKTGSYTRRLGGENYLSRIPVLAFGSNRAPTTEPESSENSSPSKEYFIECAMTLFRRDSHVPHPLHHLPFEKFEWFDPDKKSLQDDLKVQAIRWLLDGLCPPKAKESNTARVHFKPLKNEQNKIEAELKLDEGYPGGETIPFENWSEGFQTIYTLALAVIFDMMAEDSGAPLNTGLQTTMSGIVLIDEFDAHLHPRWRASILKQMKAVFPNVQFIFTTHDPVILRGMPTSNVFRLPAPKDGKVTPINLKEATYLTGFEIDDLLISELFNMDILRDEEEAEYYERYLRLLLKKAHADRARGNPEKAKEYPELNQEEQKELQSLRRRCGGGYAGFGHPRDQLILPVIDTIYAEYREKNSSSSSKSSEDEHIQTVKKLLVEIWNR
ncbi:MAG: AAA family ATPase [Candidatus Contendobacter sp.]